MLGRVGAIALNTYREAVRARILLGLAGLALAVSLYSIVIGAFTLRNAARVVSDLGAASLSLFAVTVAIVLAATSLHRELEQKTIFPILARPIRRTEYLVGKYAGALLTLAVFLAADTAFLLLIVAGLGGRSVVLVTGIGFSALALLAGLALRGTAAATFGPIPWSAALLVVAVLVSGNAAEERRLLLTSSALTLFEVSVVAAMTMLFSSFSSPFLSSVFTLMLFIICRSTDALATLPIKFFEPFGEAIHAAGVVLSRILPNLHVYVPARPLLTGEAPDVHLPTYLALAGAQAVAWSAGLIVAAAAIFRRRDFL